MINLLLILYLIVTSSGVGEIKLTSTDGLGNCVQLFTCTTGPIQGNLLWYAEFSNGSEIRFARNDGGNAEPSPPYNEITLEGVTNYDTRVTRGIMIGNLFTDFNSTLAFNVINITKYQLISISCGSTTANSSKITPPEPQFNKKGDYQLFETEMSTKHTLVCNGTNIPLNFIVGNCTINITSNILQWIINETVIFRYDYVMGFLRNVSKYSDIYEVSIMNLERDGDKLNIITQLQIPPELPPGTPISCGSDLFNRSMWTVPREERECPLLSHTEVSKSILYQNKRQATYNCEKGYILEGRRVLECQNGSWSGNPPTCVEGATWLQYDIHNILIAFLICGYVFYL